MRKALALLVLLAVVISAAVWLKIIPLDRSSGGEESVSKTESSATRSPALNEEMKAVWINYLEVAELIANKTKDQCTAAVREAFDQTAAAGLNAVIVHVRSHSDAVYQSDYFPWSPRVYSGEGNDGPGFDPLAVMVEQAHACGLQFHAWINPYRVSSGSTDPAALPVGSPAREWLTDDHSNNDDWAVVSGNGIYYNPAIPQVRERILNGVREIVNNYDVDGIHYDDYFYPTTDVAFDSHAYAAYSASTGDQALSLAEWRRVQTNLLVSGTYQAVKQLKSKVLFGISPMASIQSNLDICYADVSRWGSTAGYVDYLCPQIYFGFDYPTSSGGPSYRFEDLVYEWRQLATDPGVSLVFGLAPYKIGQEDAGSNEWQTRSDILKRQLLFLRELDEYAGVAFYNYSAFFDTDEAHTAERNNITTEL